jgi:hypothetical protein
MAKKKSVKQDEVKENASECALESEQTELSEDSNQASSDAVLKPTHPENIIENIDALSTTGEIVVDDMPFVDHQLLSRLRQAYLTPSEIYREAQIFASQALDVQALLMSSEAVLVYNLVEILRMSDIWHAGALAGLSNSEQTSFS